MALPAQQSQIRIRVLPRLPVDFIPQVVKLNVLCGSAILALIASCCEYGQFSFAPSNISKFVAILELVFF
jgi:hypothetical protein